MEHGVGRGQGEVRRYIYLCSDPLHTGETRKRIDGRQKAKKDKIGSNFNNFLIFQRSREDRK